MSSALPNLTSAEVAIALLFGGTHVSGYVIHWGILPPGSGSGRRAMLHQRGIRELEAAKALFSRARTESGCRQAHALESPRAPWWRYAPVARAFSLQRLCDGGQRGEDAARAALHHAVRALNLLEDLDEALDAHRVIHEIGAFISWHYKCRITLNDGRWAWQCPVILSHIRMGLSAGFTAQRICSICEGDISECPHLPNQQYRVAVTDADNCPCGNDGCEDHQAGETIEAYPSALIRRADLHETSLVARPRDPLARISKIEFSDEQLRAMLRVSEIPANVDSLECLHCRQACTGLWDERAFPWARRNVDSYPASSGAELSPSWPSVSAR